MVVQVCELGRSNRCTLLGIAQHFHGLPGHHSPVARETECAAFAGQIFAQLADTVGHNRHACLDQFGQFGGALGPVDQRVVKKIERNVTCGQVIGEFVRVNPARHDQRLVKAAHLGSLE